MRTTNILFLILSCGLLLYSCKSGVTLKEVTKQEEQARENLQDAHAAMIELAELKQRYSVDDRDREIDRLQKQQEEIEDDIDKLEGVSSSGAEGGAQALAQDLERQNNEIANQIAGLKNRDQENWAAAIDSINTNVMQLEKTLDQITRNLPDPQDN